MILKQVFAFATQVTVPGVRHLRVGGRMTAYMDGKESGTDYDGVWSKFVNDRPSRSWKLERMLPQPHTSNPAVHLIDANTLLVASVEKIGVAVSIVSMLDPCDDRMGFIPTDDVLFGSEMESDITALKVVLFGMFHVHVTGATYRNGVRIIETWRADIDYMDNWSKV